MAGKCRRRRRKRWTERQEGSNRDLLYISPRCRSTWKYSRGIEIRASIHSQRLQSGSRWYRIPTCTLPGIYRNPRRSITYLHPYLAQTQTSNPHPHPHPHTLPELESLPSVPVPTPTDPKSLAVNPPRAFPATIATPNLPYLHTTLSSPLPLIVLEPQRLPHPPPRNAHLPLQDKMSSEIPNINKSLPLVLVFPVY